MKADLVLIARIAVFAIFALAFAAALGLAVRIFIVVSGFGG